MAADAKKFTEELRRFHRFYSLIQKGLGRRMRLQGMSQAFDVTVCSLEQFISNTSSRKCGNSRSGTHLKVNKEFIIIENMIQACNLPKCSRSIWERSFLARSKTFKQPSQSHGQRPFSSSKTNPIETFGFIIPNYILTL